MFYKKSFLFFIVIGLFMGINAVSLFAETTITIPPLKISENATKGVSAGDWKAAEPPAALDFAKTKKLAEDAEKDDKIAEALTLWEHVLDRTDIGQAHPLYPA